MIVSPVDQSHPHRDMAQGTGRGEATKSATDNDDMLAEVERCCCKRRRRPWVSRYAVAHFYARRSDHGNGRPRLAAWLILPIRTQAATITSRIISASDVPIRIASIPSSLTNRFFVGRIGSSFIGEKLPSVIRDCAIVLEIPWSSLSRRSRYRRRRP